jgi:predicted XRE-type DNA-binding protein
MARRLTFIEEPLAQSQNVFADLGFADAVDLQSKSALVFEITRTMESRGLTEAAAAQLLVMEASWLESILSGDLNKVTTEQLFRMLNGLGQDVEIVVSDNPAKASRPATVRVSHASIA